MKIRPTGWTRTATSPPPQFLAENPTIKILVYTDDPEKVIDGLTSALGIGLMKRHIEAHKPAFSRICLKLISRNSDDVHHADNRLDMILKKESYDQIWFFGIHQINKRIFALGIGGGGPHSELEKAEVAALRCWMDKGGGVLITGDHANHRPPDAIPTGQDTPCAKSTDDEEFLSLGRAIGHCVPRAGLLRKWEGPPTKRITDSYNTMVLASGTDPDDSGLQMDRVPQQLILRTFNIIGKPVLNGQPHPLFFYKKGQPIRVFPDHMHEGAVITPKKLDKKVWPKKSLQPRPRVVAFGLDKRTGRRLKLVTAYNGDLADVGRIVADSTWHHYFNVNLESFRPPAEENSVADQIGQYYANLALWLSPRERRYEMACAMIHFLANHSLMIEEVGGHVLDIGRAAYSILSQTASPCEMHELIFALFPEDQREQIETLYFPDQGLVLSPLPTKELILGCVIDEYHKRLISSEDRRADLQDVITPGLERAFETHVQTLDSTARAAHNLINLGSSQERRNTMAICVNHTWTMDLTTDRQNPQTETFTFDLTINGGRITGRVINSDLVEVSKLIGRCRSSLAHPNKALMHFVFRLKKGRAFNLGVALIGVATQESAVSVVFDGGFHIFNPDNTVPPGGTGDTLNITALDPGDTGTGGGSQTRIFESQGLKEEKRDEGDYESK